MAPNGNVKNLNGHHPRSEDLVKRTRSLNMYELSQELLDKQIELLERKYGGHARANHAARIIQRAFRHYSMRKKFAKITAMAKDEKRLVRRLNSTTSGTPISSHYQPSWEAASRHYHHQQHQQHLQQHLLMEDPTVIAENAIRNNFASLYRDLERSMDTNRPRRLPSMRQVPVQHPAAAYNSLYHSQRSYNYIQQQHLQQQLYYQAEGSANYSGRYPSQQRRSSDHRVSPGTNKTQTKRIPPQVPRRTCSVLSTTAAATTTLSAANGIGRSPGTTENGKRGHNSVPGSPYHHTSSKDDSTDGACYSSSFSLDGNTSSSSSSQTVPSPGGASLERFQDAGRLPDSVRKRQYRVGLNLFNKKPERGVAYLIRMGFVENSPRAVAKLLMTRKGISKQMIGEFLGNLQNPFNISTLNCFSEEMDFAGMDIDVALRKFQGYFRMPGEAQKIERLMEVFGNRFCQCNPGLLDKLRNPDTVFVLAFAIIMLNTDLHTPCMKEEKRMKLEDFIKNLRGIDDGADIERDLLVGIYERVKANEFKAGVDHVTQVFQVQQSIVGKKPNLVQPHRRLVCYCRFYEVADMSRRERAGLHQREVFLFNDLLVVTKMFSKKKNHTTYTFRQSFPLAGLALTFFETPYYQFGIRISHRVDNTTVIMFNARNEHDRSKFCEDLREAIMETDEMEALRIETELEKQRTNARPPRIPREKTENRDSGVADMDPGSSQGSLAVPEEVAVARAVSRENADPALKRTTLSNSLLDIHEPCDRYQRRNSVGSLDSGMSISYQSIATNSSVSRDASPKNIPGKNRGLPQIFSHKREMSRTSPYAHTTDV